MKYAKLGHTGLVVSKLCLGTMTFGGDGGIWKFIGKQQQEDGRVPGGQFISSQPSGAALEKGPEEVQPAQQQQQQGWRQRISGGAGGAWHCTHCQQHA